MSPKKDYGTSSSGAMRESIGTKVDTTLVPYELIIQAAIGLNYGAEKYEPRNYEKGLSYRQLCGSIDRHNRAIMAGELYDQDSGLPHITLLASSIAMFCHNWMQGRIIDDLPPPKEGLTIAQLSCNPVPTRGISNDLR